MYKVFLAFLMTFYALTGICQNEKPTLDTILYNTTTRVHTSIKPFFNKAFNKTELADSVSHITMDSTSRKSWIHRKVFTEHLIDVKKEDYTAYIDFLPDFIIGKADNKNTWLNTRGFQIGGTVAKNFSFYTSGYENQGQFADYYLNYINAKGVVPGQSYDRNQGKPGLVKDWSYATALISYSPIKYLNISIGQDKNFIGDGYRSMILSDVSSNYPFIKLIGTLGNVQYMAMWASMQDPNATQISYDAGLRKKGGVFHYLDWNVNNRLSVGFFDAIIWAQYDDGGNKRGFDWSYANPVIFLRPLEATSGSPDNAVIGFTSKYEVLKNTVLYGQFMLDEFRASDFFSKSGSFRNKWSSQLGFRGSNLFTITGLNYLAEYNISRPYTYSGRNAILSYSNYAEPLAHPYGANFKEAVGILSYSWKRLNLYSKLNLANYGLDPSASANFGKNIFKPYTSVKLDGHFIAQGINTDLIYFDNRISFFINPKTNLRLELGAIYRNERNSLSNQKTTWLTFGLRSSFRNLYQDF